MVVATAVSGWPRSSSQGYTSYGARNRSTAVISAPAVSGRFPQLGQPKISNPGRVPSGQWPPGGGGDFRGHDVSGVPSNRSSGQLRSGDIVQRPDNVFAQTHTSGFPAAMRPSSSLSVVAYLDPLRAGGAAACGQPHSLRSNGSHLNSDASSVASSARRFYATAPAPRLSSDTVEEATGVRLSNSQLSALKRRYQGGRATFGGGDLPNNNDIRREVFGSLVLQPGQWPKLGGIAEQRSQTPSERSALNSTTTSRISGRHFFPGR